MSELFKFAEFELDTSAYKLRHNGASVAIEPLVFDLLVLLVRKVGSVVTRDELIELIWDGRLSRKVLCQRQLSLQGKLLAIPETRSGSFGRLEGVVSNLSGSSRK